MTRARFDSIIAHVFERSGPCNCDGLAEEELKLGLQLCIRELATKEAKVTPNITPAELHDTLVVESMSG